MSSRKSVRDGALKKAKVPFSLMKGFIESLEKGEEALEPRIFLGLVEVLMKETQKLKDQSKAQEKRQQCLETYVAESHEVNQARFLHLQESGRALVQDITALANQETFQAQSDVLSKLLQSAEAHRSSSFVPFPSFEEWLERYQGGEDSEGPIDEGLEVEEEEPEEVLSGSPRKPELVTLQLLDVSLLLGVFLVVTYCV